MQEWQNLFVPANYKDHVVYSLSLFNRRQLLSIWIYRDTFRSYSWHLKACHLYSETTSGYRIVLMNYLLILFFSVSFAFKFK